MNEFFHKIAHKASEAVGNAWVFCVALLLVVVWVLLGPLFDYSDEWQLWINTTTTIITFLMVFLIQNTQNRDTKVIQLKLDELIRASKPARDRLVDLEDLSDEELERLQKEFERIRERAAQQKAKG